MAQIVSDLHIEQFDGEVDPSDFITPVQPILIMAGDIGSLYKLDQLGTFLRQVCTMFEQVFYVPGNHEFYLQPGHSPLSLGTLYKRLDFIQALIPNLTILNKKAVRFGDTIIAGCTLWSKPEIKIPSYLVRIHNITTDIYTYMHNTDVEFIQNTINFCKKNKLKLILATHYCPSFRVYDGVKLPTKRRKVISLYASSLDHLITDTIQTWVAGHTHINFDFHINNTRIVSNQKGKQNDRIRDYSKDFQIKF